MKSSRSTQALRQRKDKSHWDALLSMIDSRSKQMFFLAISTTHPSLLSAGNWITFHSRVWAKGGNVVLPTATRQWLKWTISCASSVDQQSGQTLSAQFQLQDLSPISNARYLFRLRTPTMISKQRSTIPRNPDTIITPNPSLFPLAPLQFMMSAAMKNLGSHWIWRLHRINQTRYFSHGTQKSWQVVKPFSPSRKGIISRGGSVYRGPCHYHVRIVRPSPS